LEKSLDFFLFSSAEAPIKFSHSIFFDFSFFVSFSMLTLKSLRSGGGNEEKKGGERGGERGEREGVGGGDDDI
jgi:hypothetical protein